jgi:tetraacyldisaccharide 4'-kinase
MKTPRFWKRRGLLAHLFYPMSRVYALGARLDRYGRTPTPAPLPILSIGNAIVGGAGKTPTALALCALLKQLGHQPHIAVRGYGGEVLHAHRVAPEDSWQRVGDEALLLAEAAPTWVGRDRLASADAAAKAGASLLICDDAHQHHALQKNRALLVVDGAYGIGNGWVMPAGPLREPWADALTRADAVLLIGEDTHNLCGALSIPVFRAELRPTTSHAALDGKRLLAFAGIGRPEKFYHTLRGLSGEMVECVDYPDHHAYTRVECARLLARAAALDAIPVTTRKDIVKWPADLAVSVRVVDVEIVFSDPAPLTAWLQAALPVLNS